MSNKKQHDTKYEVIQPDYEIIDLGKGAELVRSSRFVNDNFVPYSAIYIPTTKDPDKKYELFSCIREQESDMVSLFLGLQDMFIKAQEKTRKAQE